MLPIRIPSRYLIILLALASSRAASADVVTIHVEAIDDPGPVLEQIRSSGAAAGLALNPATPVATITRSKPAAISSSSSKRQVRSCPA